MKTYEVLFVTPHGNGWAIVNSDTVDSVRSILENQSKFQPLNILHIKERKVICGLNTSIIYEGHCETLMSPYDLAVSQGYEGSLEDWLESLKADCVQSDWNQEDDTQLDYIKNKPSNITNVQTDWEETDNTDDAYLENMPGVFRDPWHNTEGLPTTIPDGTVIERVVQDYDGNWYDGVVMNNQIWMKENLRVTHNPSGASITYYHANGDASNDETYGLLYDWNTVMNGASSSDAVPSGVQGIAPDGWHIPSGAEWDNFAIYVGQQSQYILNNNSTYIAKALASKDGWDASTTDYTPGKNPENNNLTNFSVYPAGYFWSASLYFGRSAYLWMTNDNYNKAKTITISCERATCMISNTMKREGKSVRCICNTSASDWFAANRGRLYLKLIDSGMVWKQLSEVAESGSYNDLSNQPTIPSAINDLSDVDITDAVNQNVLMYDSTSSKWKNATIPSGVTSLSALSDVDLDSLSNGQMLQYNSTSQKWENVDIPSDAFICTFTQTTDPQTEESVLSCDKTIAEIIAAANDGKTVLGKIRDSDENNTVSYISLTAVLEGVVNFAGFIPWDGVLVALIGIYNSSTDTDSWFVENGQFASVAFSGDYGDLSNTPILGTAAALDVAASGNASSTQVVKGDDTRLTDSRPASDVSAWAKAATKPTYTATEVGAIPTTEKDSANGVATLNSNGKIPSHQLPSYVDDVLEYNSYSDLPATGERGKIYVTLDTNKTYRWGGSAYTEISESLALGETSSTAYPGDKGKANADYIAAIKDGNSIDSFGDVETALADKINKVSNPTNGNFAALDSNGNVVDSGHKHSDYLTSQENADWNATSGPAKILNKPTIPASVSGTNDGTNWTSLTIGSVTKAIPQGGSSLPSQTGNSGKFLTTDGTDASWANLPSDVVYCTWNGSTCSMTAKEIYEAYLDGKTVICKASINDSYISTVLCTMTRICYFDESSPGMGDDDGFVEFIGKYTKPTIDDEEDNIYRITAIKNEVLGYTSWTWVGGDYINLENLQDAISTRHSHSNKTYLNKIPSSVGSNGQVLTSNGTSWSWQTPSGGGGLTNYDFTHTATQAVSGSVTVTYAAYTRGSRMVSASADLSVTFAVNNSSDNYLWIKNTGSSDIDILISSVTYNNSSVSNVYMPDDGISVPSGKVCEIGIVCNADGAFITSRSDLSL